MNRDDVIRMAREAGAWVADDQYSLLPFLERFAALVAAHVRETEFKPDWINYQQGKADGAAAEREKSLRLWMLLDDVDTADDIAKSDDAVYRSLCRQAHQKRWAVMTGDEVDAAIRAKGETK